MPGGNQLVAFTRILHRTQPDILVQEARSACSHALGAFSRNAILHTAAQLQQAAPQPVAVLSWRQQGDMLRWRAPCCPGAQLPGGPADARVRHLVRVPSVGPAQCGCAVYGRGCEGPHAHQGAHSDCNLS